MTQFWGTGPEIQGDLSMKFEYLQSPETWATVFLRIVNKLVALHQNVKGLRILSMLHFVTNPEKNCIPILGIR